VTDKADRITGAVFWSAPGGPGLRRLTGDDLLYEDDEFDGLLAASSFGSLQALAIRQRTPASAREHAQRVVDGEEMCEPPEGDVDDAVGELVYGIAHSVAPNCSDTDPQDEHHSPGKVFFASPGKPGLLKPWTALTARDSNVLWPDHRTSLLQALVDNDAFDGLRPDVAWRIVDYIFDVPCPPRVLNQCAMRVLDQLDVGALADTWLRPLPRRRNAFRMLRYSLWPDEAPNGQLLSGEQLADGPFGGVSVHEPTSRLAVLPCAPPPAAPQEPGPCTAPRQHRDDADGMKEHTAVVVLQGVLAAAWGWARGIGIRVLSGLSIRAAGTRVVLVKRVCVRRRDQSAGG